MRRDEGGGTLRNLFFAQLLGIVVAAVVFQLSFDPRVAGLVAGTVFVSVGMYGMRVGWNERRNRSLSLSIFAIGVLHVVGVAVPMLIFRILSWDQPFSKVAVWGLSGPEFHSLSTRLYGVWMTVVAFAWWLQRKKDPRGSFFRR